MAQNMHVLSWEQTVYNVKDSRIPPLHMRRENFSKYSIISAYFVAIS